LERLTAGRVAIVWRTATVRAIVDETAHARTLELDVPDWPGHLAGQHVDVRLTAEDGYQAQRSYSIASAPEAARLALTVERIDDGEVSPYLCGELLVGDPLELRGPIGGPFTWRAEQDGPLLLLAGGSGLVPLMAMLRHREAIGSSVEAHLLVSSRAWDDLLYRDELARLAPSTGLEISYTLTRERPEGWTGFARRVDAAMLQAVAPPIAAQPRVYVCGPTPFVESVADALVGLGYDPGSIHAERFGPTG
jgi:ferredoxin-NADP reductase